MDLSTKIRKLRQSHHQSQTQLANKLHVTRQTVSNWENDRRHIDNAMINKIEKLYNVKININDEKKTLSNTDNNNENNKDKNIGKHKEHNPHSFINQIDYNKIAFYYNLLIFILAIINVITFKFTFILFFLVINIILLIAFKSKKWWINIKKRPSILISSIILWFALILFMISKGDIYGLFNYNKTDIPILISMTIRSLMVVYTYSMIFTLYPRKKSNR